MFQHYLVSDVSYSKKDEKRPKMFSKVLAQLKKKNSFSDFK